MDAPFCTFIQSVVLGTMKRIILWSLYGIFAAGLLAAGGVRSYFRADRNAILDAFRKIDTAEDTRDYAPAYSIMSPEYRSRVTFEQFPDECRQMSIVTAPTVHMEWNKKKATLTPGMWCGGAVLGFVKANGQWLCTGLEGWAMD